MKNSVTALMAVLLCAALISAAIAQQPTVPFCPQPPNAPPPGLHCPDCNAVHLDMPPLMTQYRLHCPRCQHSHGQDAWHRLPNAPTDNNGQKIAPRSGYEWVVRKYWSNGQWKAMWVQEQEVKHVYDINEVLKYIDPKAPKFNPSAPGAPVPLGAPGAPSPLGAPGVSNAPAVNPNLPAYGSGAPAVNPNAPAYGSSAPAVTLNAPAYGSGVPAVNSNVPAYGSGAPAVELSAPVYNTPSWD